LKKKEYSLKVLFKFNSSFMNLYLYIEILNREFLSKLLISMESASKGINVYIGRIRPYLMREFFVPGVVMLKSITPSQARISELEYYKKKGISVTSLDEEVGLINQDKKYLKLRYSNKTIALTDKIFTWGKFDYNNLSKKFTKYKSKFILTGNPRIDFWRKDFTFFFKKKKLKQKNYLFFSLNFSFLISQKKFNEYLTFLKESDYINRGFTIKAAKKLRHDSHRMFKEFSKLIIALSKKINQNIVVRPHPTEEVSNYNFLKKYKNIIVTKDGSISEWIYNSRIVIHSGCTGGFESSIRGIPTIAYVPFNSVHGHKYANKFSKKISKLSNCIKYIDKELKKNQKLKKKNMLKINNKRIINLNSKNPAYKIISNQFLKIFKKKKYELTNNDFILKIKFGLRDLRSKILGLKYGNEIKFKYFDKQKVLEDFEILKNLNPKFKNLKINFLKKDIIQIKN
jgi:surface carbohydrate biosynthesis protein